MISINFDNINIFIIIVIIMTRFIKNFILIFFIIIMLPLFGLILFNQSSMQVDKNSAEYEMKRELSANFSSFIDKYLYNQQNLLQNNYTPSKNSLAEKVKIVQKPMFQFDGNFLNEILFINYKGSVYKIKKRSDISNDFFIPAPIMISIYSRDKDFLICSINEPPFKINKVPDIYINNGNVTFAITMFQPPDFSKKAPPLFIPPFVILLVSFILCLFLAVYLKNTFLSPINIIISGLSKIKDGNFNFRFNTNSKNAEIKQMFETLNELINSLNMRDKLRDHFIKNVVHDLRAPLIAQNRAISILQEDFSGGNVLLTGMEENNTRYLNMINQILECYTIDDCNTTYIKTKIDLSELAISIKKSLESLLIEKNISLKINIDSDKAVVFADYLSMVRILTNLIANCIENIEKGKEIKIEANNIDNSSVIIVEDNGNGIKSEYINHLFDKHVSLNRSGAKVVSGLGLSIVKELVEKNGGNIFIESEIEKYTRFRIILPNEEEK